MVRRSFRDRQRRRLRVLQVHHFSYPDIRGGVDRVVAALVDASGADDTVVFEVAGPGERVRSLRRERGIAIHRAPLHPLRPACGIVRHLYDALFQAADLVYVVWVLRRERIDLVHLHTLQDYHWYFAVLARYGLCKYVVTLHGSETSAYPDRPKAQQRRWAKVLAHANRVTAVSRTLAGLAVQNLPVRTRPQVVYNGVADPGTRAGALGPRADGNAYAVCVGALRPIKGHDIAVAAWGDLAGQGVSLRLCIAGEGDYRGTLESLIARHGCERTVALLGALDYADVLDLVAGADIFVMPSRNEGMGLALIEAAALARPIVAADIPVFREIIQHGENGLLYTPEDAKALADCIVRLADDDAYRARLGAGARSRFLQAFTGEKVAAAYRQLYNDCVGTRTGPPAPAQQPHGGRNCSP